MPYDANDPRLTSYALGELDAAECTTIEAELADSPDGRQVVDEIRATARLLTEQLRNESSPGLRDPQRRTIESRLDLPAPSASRMPWIAYAVAASVLVVSCILAFRTPPRPGGSRGKPMEVAQAPVVPPAAARLPQNQESFSFDAERAPTPLAEKQAELAYGGPAKAVEYRLGRAPLTAAPKLAAPTSESLAVPTQEYGADARFGDIARKAGVAGPQTPGGVMAGFVPPVPGNAPARGLAAADGRKKVTAGAAVGNKPAASRFDAFELRQSPPPAAGAAPQFAQGMGGGMGGLGGRMAGMSAGGPGGMPALQAGAKDAPSQNQSTPVAGTRLARALAPGDKAGIQDQLRSARDRAADGSHLYALTTKPQDAKRNFALGEATARSELRSGMRGGRQDPALRGDATGRQTVDKLAKSEAKQSTGAPEAVAAGLEDNQVARRVETERDLKQQLQELPKQQVEEAEARLAEQAPPPAANEAELNREAFPQIVENEFKLVKSEPLSTFSIDVDTASYANVRRYLMQHNTIPPKDAVRVEEMINYFRYNDPEPTGDQPFSVRVEIARCPWNSGHRLARIGLRGKAMSYDKRPASNLVFLIDVSGSMQADNKLPLLKSAMQALVESLGEKDRVAIVVYAATEGLVLPSTSAYRKGEILSALEQLQAGGSTNGGAGIKLAYDVASDPRNFIKEGINRVILCTDGDFNVGITDDGDLNRMIEDKRKTNVFLSVLGFGEANLQETKMKGLAKNGNGNYSYIDSIAEGRKVLIEEGGSTLVTIARDVKIQVEFNPAKVGAFRQIGYELRQMAHADFNNDAKDAGEIGAGHSVTALYELVPAGEEEKLELAQAHDLVFQKRAPADRELSKQAIMVRIKYKRLDKDTSEPELQRGVEDTGGDYAQASDDFKFSAAVASFGLVLRDSKYKGDATLAAVEELSKASLGANPNGYRSEFLELVRKAQSLAKPQ